MRAGLFRRLAEGVFDRSFAIVGIAGLRVLDLVVGRVVFGDGVLRQPRQQGGLVGSEQRGRMHEASFPEVLDQGDAGVLHLLARENRRVLARAFERGARQARQEIVGAHVRQEVVRADHVTGDAGDDAAVGAVLPARQDFR